MSPCERLAGVSNATRAGKRAAVVLAAAAALAAGCGSGPSQVNAAVIMGDKVIAVDDVQQRLDRALEAEPAAKQLAAQRKLDLVSREIVARLITHDVLAGVAEREGLSVTEAEVASYAEQRPPSEDPVQRSVDAAFDERELARDRLLLQKLGEEYLDRLSVSFDGAILAEGDAKQQASDLANRLAAAPGDAKAAIEDAVGDRALLGQELNLVTGFAISDQFELSTSPLFGVEPNTVVAFPIGEQSTAWLVALVRDRDDNNTLTEEQAGILPQLLSAEQWPVWAERIGSRLLSTAIADADLRISPRYGVWDGAGMTVVPSEQELSGLVLPASNPAP